ncbi:hypothetical protein E1A91_A02G103200v1 [Gossypium mustelinum]|uniref:Plant PDR ABC transporter associated domain-containing protein n=1 Tax=Gossypium mustelinum TaxID=34275 RepID=A0A5D3A3P0_GOSMU|nr:hypothetical protein E1A91_A02G103200v1 [Gossypium mustelinum]
MSHGPMSYISMHTWRARLGNIFPSFYWFLIHFSLVSFDKGYTLLLLDQIKPWWVWASWLSPLEYAQRAVSINEFTATRWKKISATGNNTIGYNVLHQHGLPSAKYWYWLGVGVGKKSKFWKFRSGRRYCCSHSSSKWAAS